MIRRTFLLSGAAAGLALAGCAPLAGTNPLSREERRSLRIAEFDVRTTGAAFTSAGAREQSSSLASDLSATLRREFADRMSAGGETVVVEIAALNIAGATATAFGRDQSRLRGQATLTLPGGAPRASYAVDVIAGEAAETRTGALASAAVTTRGGLYRELLSRFARDTRTQMLGADLPGERLVRQVTN